MGLQYHVVICPKYRKRKLYRSTRRKEGENSPRPVSPKGCRVVEGRSDARPRAYDVKYSLEYSVAMTMGSVKGKIAIRITVN